MCVFECSGVNISRAGNLILRDVSLQIRPGTVTRICGVNGSGKTSLLAMIAGQVRADFEADGFRVYQSARGKGSTALDARHTTSFIYPALVDRFAAFDWPVTVRGIIEGGFDGTPVLYRSLNNEEQKRMSDIAELCAINEWLERDFRTLSRGQATLVLSARALVKNPPLLLLDEAGHEPDVTVLQNMRRIVRRAAAGGMALIYTSHHDDMLFDADAVLEVSNGRLQNTVDAAGTAVLSPQDLVDRFYHPLPDVPDETVRLKNVVVYHDDKPGFALEHFSARAGEQWLIKGRNGSGKTTMLHLLYGLHRPAAGGAICRFSGRFRTLEDERKLMAYAGAWAHGCWAGYTVHEVVQEAAGGHALMKDLMRDLALDRFLTREFSTLSYGEQRKIVLACALLRSPTLFLLDEPFNGLDRAAREYFRKVVAALMRRGGRFICVLHHDEDSVDGLEQVLELEAPAGVSGAV